jgi:hypothetical protein
MKKKITIPERLMIVDLNGESWEEVFGISHQTTKNVSELLAKKKNIAEVIITLLESGRIEGILQIMRIMLSAMPKCKCHDAPGKKGDVSEDKDKGVRV